MNVNIQQANRSILLLLSAIALTACGGHGGNTIAGTDNSAADDAAATLNNQQAQVQTQANQATTPSLAASARASADVRLAWAAPLERTDGSELLFSEISGYQISYEDSKGRLRIAPKDTLLLEPARSSYILEDLPADNYQINIFTVDTNGVISPASATITLQADQFPTS